MLNSRQNMWNAGISAIVGFAAGLLGVVRGRINRPLTIPSSD
jgi:hypothetical protein